MPDPANHAPENNVIRLCLLHAGLQPDDLDANLSTMQEMVLQAMDAVPDLIVMPELALSGYEFNKFLGTDWVSERIPQAVEWFAAFARQNQVSVVFTAPRYDAEIDALFNSALLLDASGEVAGWHNKINVLTGSEGWAEKGTTADPIPWNGRQLGLLICADMYTPTIVSHLVGQGAEMIVSPANWAPGMHEPDGEWERASLENGISVVVCNRTGKEDRMDFRGSASAVVADGKRVLEYTGAEPAILVAELEASTWWPRSEQFVILPYFP